MSIVFPLFDEEQVVDSLRVAVSRFLGEIRCGAEVILVNDGSRDGTLLRLVDWANQDPRVKVIHLSRNFGHQFAATAGLEHATGEAVVLMDADLQDPLAVIHQMIDCYCEGYEVVYGQRESRGGETLFKRFTAWLFYRLMRILVFRDLPVDTGDFRLMSRQCLQTVIRFRETHRFLRGIVAWVGFPTIAVRYCREPRAAGEGKYTLAKMLKLAGTAAMSFSALPLRLSLFLGLCVGLFAVEEIVRALLANWRGNTLAGWTSLMIVTSVIGSAILVSIGIVGEYVARVYEQGKDRPLYVVARTYNLEANERDASAGLSSRADTTATRSARR